MMTQCITDQVCGGLRLHLVQEIGLVGADRLDAQAELARDSDILRPRTSRSNTSRSRGVSFACGSSACGVRSSRIRLCDALGLTNNRL